MAYNCLQNEQRTNAEQSDSSAELRVSHESVDHLYVMQLDRDGPIKIGRSRDVYKRQVNLQANCPYDVDTLFTINGGGDLEPVWHEAFADSRLRGEWFEWTPEVREAIKAYRSGDEDWIEQLLPPFGILADATVDYLDDPDAFEVAYWNCVEDWRDRLRDRLSAVTAQTKLKTGGAL